MASLREIAGKSRYVPKYNKAESIEKYSKLFFETSPEYGKFKTFENLKNRLLSSNEKSIFRDISDELYNHLLAEGMIDKINNRDSILTEKGRDKKSGKTDRFENLTIENAELQNRDFKHRETIRDQEQRIRNLDEALKTYDVVKKYWYLVFIFLSVIYKALELAVVYIYNNIQ